MTRLYCVHSIMLLFFMSSLQSFSQERGAAYINLKGAYFERTDTLIARIYKNHTYGLLDRAKYEELKVISKNGNYKFFLKDIIPLSRITIFKSDEILGGELPTMPILRNYLISPGDSIHINVKPKTGGVSLGVLMNNGKQVYEDNMIITFGGKGMAKYVCRWVTDSISRIDMSGFSYVHRPFELVGKDVSENISNQRNFNLSLIRKANIESCLELYRPWLTEDEYWQLKADYIGKYEFKRIYNSPMGREVYSKDSIIFEKAKGTYFESFSTLEGMQIPLEYRLNSPDFQSYISRRASVAYKVELQSNGEKYPNVYTYLKSMPLETPLMDKLLTEEIVDIYSSTRDSKLRNDALNTVKDPVLLDVIKGLDYLHNGNPAYSFNLPNQQDKYISLNDLKGKVVFMDFWYLSCLACRVYLQDVVKPLFEEKYKNDERVAFVTVSTESKNMFLKGLEWAALEGENSYDLYTDNKEYTHPIIKFYNIRGYPYPLIIDKNGNIFGEKEMNLRSKEGLEAAIEAALTKP